MAEGSTFTTFDARIVGTILKNHTDDELLQIYRAKKSADVITILFNRYYHLIYGVCMKYLKNTENAKDATMQIFEKLMDDIPKHDIQFFKAWLYRVAQNFCLMQLRSRKYNTVSFDLIEERIVESGDRKRTIADSNGTSDNRTKRRSTEMCRIILSRKKDLCRDNATDRL